MQLEVADYRKLELIELYLKSKYKLNTGTSNKINGFFENLNYNFVEKSKNPCMDCSNNPLNGGDGICHCTLGSNDVDYLIV